MRKIFAIFIFVLLLGNVFAILFTSVNADDELDDNLEAYGEDDLENDDVREDIEEEADTTLDRRLTIFDGDSISPVIVRGDDETFHMAWADDRILEDNTTQSMTVFYKQSTTYGDSWTPDTPISIRNMPISSVDLTIDGRNLAVAWEENLNSYVIFSFDNGMSWTEPYEIPRATGPSIALKGENLYMSIKNKPLVGNPYIEGMRITVDPIGGSFQPYNFNPSGTQIFSVADITVEGDFVHFAIKDEMSGQLIYYKGTNNGTTWAGGVLTSCFGEDTPKSVNIKAKDNNVRIIWCDNRDGNYDLYMKASSDFGDTWNPEIKLADTIGNSLNPSISIDSDLYTHVCWEEVGDTSYILYREYDENGNQQSEKKITSGVSNSSKPTISLDSRNHYFVLWQDDRDNNEEIYFTTNLGEFDNQLINIINYIEDIPDEGFDKNPDQRKNALLQKIDAVKSQLQEESYLGAKNKLENDILAKMDGFSGGNSKDDWITDQEIQEELTNLIFVLLTMIEVKLDDDGPIGGSEWCDIGTSSDATISLGPCRYPNTEWSGIYSFFGRTYRYGYRYSNFLVNIENQAWAKNIDYRVTLVFYASANVPVYQWGGGSVGYKHIGTLPGNSNWRTYSLETNHLWNYDYRTESQYNLLFQFNSPIYVDSITVIPVEYHDNVGTSGDNSISEHDPGVSIYPNTEWSGALTIDGRSCKLGGDRSNAYMNSPDMDMEYKIEFTYKSKNYYTDSGGSFQQWTGSWYYHLGYYICDQQWHTVVFHTNRAYYYDYGGNANRNVLFEFTRSLYIDSMKITAARDYCNVGSTGDNSATTHEPGPSIYPNGEWSGWTTKDSRSCRYGNAGSNIYLNEIDTNKDYVITITYKSPSYSGYTWAGSFRQWDGSAYHSLGTYIADDNWHTVSFTAKSFWYYDYNGAGHTYGINALFEFSRQLWIDEIKIGVMEKYAVLVSGFDPDGSHNGMHGFDSFRYDIEEMYDAVKLYGYSDANIYCYFWDGTETFGGKVDGAATWITPAGDGNIKNAIKEIGDKITSDDFFYFFETSHGFGSTLTNGGFYVYYPSAGVDYVRALWYSEIDTLIDDEIGSKSFRSALVLASCNSGSGTLPLKGTNRIIITAARAGETTYFWHRPYWPTLWHTDDDHMEFLHNDNSNKPGFTQSLNAYPTSLLTAYNKAYDAGAESDVWPFDDESHAQLEDSGDGLSHEKGSLGNDGYLATYTYL